MSLEAARGSVVRLRSNVKTPKRCEPSIRKVLLHRRRTLYVLRVDDHDALKAVLCYKPGNFLSGSLEDGVVSVHPVQVVVKEDYLEILLFQSSEGRLCILGKDRIGHPLPEPRNAIFRVLDDENRPVRWDMELLAHAIPTPRQRFTESIHLYILSSFVRQKPVTSVMSGEYRCAVVSVLDEGEQ
jgi:hypothetical protein